MIPAAQVAEDYGPLFFAVGVAVQRLLVARLAPENLAMMMAVIVVGGFGSVRGAAVAAVALGASG